MLKQAPFYGLLLLAFAAGLMMGIYLGDRMSWGSGAGSATSSRSDGFINDEVHDRVEQNVIYTRRIKELEDELAKQKSGEADLLTDHLQFLKKHPESLSGLMYDTDLKVSQQAVDYLKITPSEKSAVEGHLAQIREELKDEMEAKVTLEKQSATAVTFQIPTISHGATLRKQMSDLLTSDLVADRAAALIEVNGWQEKAQLYDFGVAPIEVQIRQTTPDDSAGNLAYRIRLSGSGKGNEWGNEWNFGGDLPPAFQGLIPFEPTPPPAPVVEH